MDKTPSFVKDGNGPAAVVTGSSSGIGQTIAERLLEDGWVVHGFDIAAPRVHHPRFHAVHVDLGDGQATSEAALRCNHVDALIHAAGMLRVGRLGSLRPEDADLMWRLHVAAALRLADVLLPAMAARRAGRVVLIGSRVAQGKAGRSQYAATKAALIALARSWAAEVVADGVTVNVVSPAATQTAMLDDPGRSSETAQVPPIGRLIQPREVAAMVAFLLSESAGAVTGQDIQICGGSSLAR